MGKYLSMKMPKYVAILSGADFNVFVIGTSAFALNLIRCSANDAINNTIRS